VQIGGSFEQVVDIFFGLPVVVDKRQEIVKKKKSLKEHQHTVRTSFASVRIHGREFFVVLAQYQLQRANRLAAVACNSARFAVFTDLILREKTMLLYIAQELNIQSHLCSRCHQRSRFPRSACRSDQSRGTRLARWSISISARIERKICSL
jgi:hypothetical protein